MKRKIIILSEKSWHKSITSNLSIKLSEFEFISIRHKKSFSLKNLIAINPYKIFIPHWSHILPEEIFNRFECVVFHMTDLPFGRGGSPLQNLIVRGFSETKISAFKIEKGIDTGPIYLKSDLELNGSAEEIFIRATNIIEKMIMEILEDKIIPKPQKGEPVYFERRKPSDSEIKTIKSIDMLYDQIRMLDAEGYPLAYLKHGFFDIEFFKAKKISNKQITANVRITKR